MPSKTWPDALNTGVLTRTMPTLDLDILNEEAVRRHHRMGRRTRRRGRHGGSVRRHPFRFEERSCPGRLQRRVITDHALEMPTRFAKQLTSCAARWRSECRPWMPCASPSAAITHSAEESTPSDFAGTVGEHWSIE
jgi:hypothetical protein